MHAEDTRRLLQLAETAVVQTAKVLIRDRNRLNAVNLNLDKDIKLDADHRAEELLFGLLEPVGIDILSEESGTGNEHCLDGTCWILDPLDGTYNYHRGFPMHAVSIALWERGTPVFGVIHDITTACSYSGQVGGAAWYDGVRIRVSDVKDTSEAVLATGFPAGRGYDDKDLRAFIRSIQAYKKIRMIGSAALSLAHVAAGRFDIYHEQDIRLWDVAAGLALVQAAGGSISTSEIRPGWKLDVTAWNGHLKPVQD